MRRRRFDYCRDRDIANYICALLLLGTALFYLAKYLGWIQTSP